MGAVMSERPGITVLGATGSIGVSTLDVIGRNSDRYRVVALTANQDVDRLVAQCLEHRPEFAVMADADAADLLVGAIEAIKRTGIRVVAFKSPPTPLYERGELRTDCPATGFSEVPLCKGGFLRSTS